ncbi:MAG TPA: carboxypeptidase-like regulatory domain-containing protein, partial [Nitrososphaeraceae archaeon]|nr:carboxypeptidase-like regulatory domain-containing protein [Nitrososphaeraceae archaeon]
MNDFKNVPLIPVKAKILPQYDESVPQPINKVKSTTEVKVNDVKEALNPTESAPASMGIKILSPKSGKEIPDGNLTILGISTDTEKSNCSVSVDLNNQKPFQKAKATGPYGDNDYSSWTFTYSPAYHTIENGINDLTSKLECVENSKVITKWHSINVTGVTTEDSKPASSLVFHDPLGILPQLKTVSTNPSASNIEKSNNDTTTASELSARLQLLKDKMYSTESQNSTMSLPIPKQLLVEASLLKGVVTNGATQTIDVKVLDANTNETVSGADVVAKIGKSNYSNGTSDASGVYSHSWNITSNTPSGKYDVLVSASANGYEPASITGNFQVQKQLLVEASLLKDVVAPGDSQNIDVKVLDANTNETVSGADVVAKIGKSNDYSGTSDESGAFS